MAIYFATQGIERNHDYPPFKYIVDFHQSLAAFLLARGPFAWFGYSWMSCIGDFGRGGVGMPPMNYTFPDELKVDYGAPSGVCKETAPNSGKFTREYSKATVELDCRCDRPILTLQFFACVLTHPLVSFAVAAPGRAQSP